MSPHIAPKNGRIAATVGTGRRAEERDKAQTSLIGSTSGLGSGRPWLPHPSRFLHFVTGRMNVWIPLHKLNSTSCTVLAIAIADAIESNDLRIPRPTRYPTRYSFLGHRLWRYLRCASVLVARCWD